MSQDKFEKWLEAVEKEERADFWKNIFNEEDNIMTDELSSTQVVNQYYAFPAVDIYESTSTLTLYIDVPGVKREHLSLQTDGSLFIIKGTLQNDHHHMSIVKKERASGTFERIISLPKNVESAACKATFQQGVLIVTFTFPS